MTDEALERMIDKGLIVRARDGTLQHRDYGHPSDIESKRYTAWDRIRDDDRAEGRTVRRDGQ